jgi:hypothetical protein
MLNKHYIRDGNRKIIGSVTTGFSDESSVVRDEGNKINSRTSERFHTTRDGHGKLVSVNSADPGLLIGRGKQR